MIVAVEFLVNRWIFDPEIGTKIDHLATQFEQGNGIFGGYAVGKARNTISASLASNSALGSLKRRLLTRG